MASLPCNYNRLKVLCLLEGPGEAVLRFILKRGTNAPTTPMSLIDYLNNLSPGSTACYKYLTQKDKKKSFNKDEKHRIAADHTWDTFDVSLLCKAIAYACEDFAHLNDHAAWGDINRLEGKITKIRQMRNNIIHEKHVLTKTQFQAKVTELKDLFMQILDAAKTKFTIPDQVIIQEKDNVDKSFMDILQQFTPQAFFHAHPDEKLPMFRRMLSKELSTIHNQTQIFDPLYFLFDVSKSCVHVQDVFTKILINEKPKDIPLNYLDIITFTQSLGQAEQRPQLLLIKGEAGSGKTTLITFILSEWLKDECDREMRSLDGYDFVLHVTCREKQSESLEEFLKQIFPSAAMFTPDMMTTFDNCRTLYLIDGLDERNDSSTRLVEDILEHCKVAPDATIICTSRPETIKEFLRALPKEYKNACGEVEGIDTKDRTTFVFNYYNNLAGIASPHRERLEYIMESVGWRDHFKLPLNLLFLAILFKEEPEKVRENTTQTGLYLVIHAWCIEKLHERLVHRRQPEIPVGDERESAVKKVLDKMYEVSLRGLLEEILRLSPLEKDQLRHCCEEERLPWREMLGSFFSLRRTQISRSGFYDVYHAPHKAMQEFFGAQHIVNHLGLEEGAIGYTSSQAGTQPQERSTGHIRTMLQNYSGEKLANFRNLLLHVAGLLSQEDETPCTVSHMEECVDLLAESGMKDCDAWLDLLQDTEINETALRRVAEHIKGGRAGDSDGDSDDSGDAGDIDGDSDDDDEEIKITDTTITSAKALLPLIPGKKVRIELHRKPPTDLRQLVHHHHTYTELHLHHHYLHPHQGAVSDSLLADLPT